MLSDPLRRLPNDKALMIFLLISLIGGCDGGGEEGIPPPLDELYNPLGLAAHPDGRYLLVTNAVFDRKYNASSLLVIDTYTGEFLSEQSAEIDLFAGELKLTKICSDPAQTVDHPDCEPRVVGVVPSRDRGTLTSFELIDQDGVPKVSCGQSAQSFRCGGNFVKPSLSEDSQKSGPFSISLTPQGAYLTHINSGLMSRWFFTDQAPIMRLGCQIRFKGANLVTQHPTTGVAVMSDRIGQFLYQTDTIPTNQNRCEFDVQPSISLGYGSVIGEGRGLAFSADGSQLYYVQSAEETLHIYQVTRVGSDQLNYQRSATIPIGRDTNIVKTPGAYSTHTLSAEQAEIKRLGEGLVYVSSLLDHQLLVIDPIQAVVIASIDVGDGPYDIEFMLNEAGELRGYVSLFKDQGISVIDLQPESPTRFTELKVIR